MFLLISSLVLFTLSWISKGKKDKVNKEMEEHRPGSRRTSYDSYSTAQGWVPHQCYGTGTVFFLNRYGDVRLLSYFLACATSSSKSEKSTFSLKVEDAFNPHRCPFLLPGRHHPCFTRFAQASVSTSPSAVFGCYLRPGSSQCAVKKQRWSHER